MADALYMHIFLDIPEFRDGIFIEFSFIVPDSGDEDYFVTGDLDADSHWWPQSKLFDILCIEWLEL